ncbi:MAG: pitrilysin family protein [Desulfomonilaceae bacterium]
MAPFCSLTSIVGWMLAAVLFCMVPMNANGMEEKLKHFILSNGLNVFIKEDHARKVAAIQLWVMVGSADEERSELGISHLIEHMAFKGTERRGVGQIAAEVEALGGEINAYTSWDETVFHITVPSSATSQGLDILTDAVMRPVIDPKELAKEKQVVLEEILEGDERPERVASKELFMTAYKSSPYRFPVIGYKEQVEKYGRKEILDFRKKWYVPDNMFLLIVGDVDSAKLRGEIEHYMDDFKPKGFFRSPRPVEPPQKEIRSSLIRDHNARETRLNIAFHIQSMKGADVNALDLAADVLGSRESSRLVRVLKKEKALVHSISAYSITPKKPGIMAISSTLDAKNLEAATQEIMKELDRLAKEPPSAEELERAKVHIESQHLYARETVQGMARSIGSFQADIGDAGYEAKYLSLNNAVTPKQLSQVVGRYLVPPNVTVSVLMPDSDRKDFQIEKLTAIINASKPETKVAVQAVSSSQVVTRTLPNGIRVVLLPDDSNPVVSFRIACLGGKRFENKEDEGIMSFIAHMLNKGTSKMSEVEISRKVEDMGGRLNGFSGYDSFGLYGNFFSRYIDSGLELLAQLYTDPTFPKDKLERERTLIINRIKTEPDRPVPYAIRVLNGTLFPNHPYGFDLEGTLATVSGFTVADLKETYQRFAVPSNTVITGAGDMDPQKAMERINELFGKIPAKALERPQVPPEEPLKKAIENVIHIPRAKAHLVIGFRGTTLADQDRYALDVLNNILAGQGGRLFLQLRDKQSLAYTVTSFDRPGVDPGVFAFYMACDAPKADRALKGLFREIELIRKAPVSDEELHRGITNLIGNHEISLQSSWSRAENIALNTLYGLGYDYESKYIKKISEVNSADVLRVAKKYLNLKQCAIVKILPAENEKKGE